MHDQHFFLEKACQAKDLDLKNILFYSEIYAEKEPQPSWNDYYWLCVFIVFQDTCPMLSAHNVLIRAAQMYDLEFISPDQEQPCLPLCCPHGQALVINEQSGDEICDDQKPRRDDQVTGWLWLWGYWRQRWWWWQWWWLSWFWVLAHRQNQWNWHIKHNASLFAIYMDFLAVRATNYIDIIVSHKMIVTCRLFRMKYFGRKMNLKWTNGSWGTSLSSGFIFVLKIS